MKKVALILIVYVGLFFSFSSVAFSAGMLMMYKITPAEKANVILARLVSGSLPVDSEGGYLIEGSKCTTSNDLLKAVKMHHPETGLVKVDELPTYLKSLQLHPAPEGKFQMSRMKCQEDSGELDLNGWAREFMENERAWFDVNLGRPILAEFCKNVVGQRIDKQSASPDTEPEPLVQGPCGRGRGLIVNV